MRLLRHFAPRDNARTAFTLAEVLITLGIIGIVAAMTLPVLTAKYQQIVLKNQFKRFYSVYSQLVNKYIAEYGMKPECYFVGNNDGVSLYKTSDCNVFVDFEKNNLNIIKKCKGKDIGCIPDYKGLDDIVREANPDKPDEELNFGFCGIWNKAEMKKQDVYVLNDGVIMIIPTDAKAHSLVDINGKKGPTKWGYDLFAFTFYSPTLQDDVRPLGATSCSSLKEKGGMTTSQMIESSFLK